MTWRTLQLNNLGVIAEAELDFSTGFTAITGETGAGKTMLITALELLRGQRADPQAVRHGSERAQVQAAVEVDQRTEHVTELITDAGGRIDDSEVILGRVIVAAGRSRALVGGSTVPASLLAEVTDELVAVHGQADQQRLVQPNQQRQALDRFAAEAVLELLTEYRPKFDRLRFVVKQVAELQQNAAERQRELEVLKHGLEEIAAADPDDGEDEQLKLEENRLAHAESLAAAAFKAFSLLADSPNSAELQLTDAIAGLDHVAGHDPQLDNLAGRIRSAAIELADVASDLSSYSNNVELDPGRLAEVQERRNQLSSLLRRYGPTAADLAGWAERATNRVAELSGDDDTIDSLLLEQQQLEQQLGDLARRLTALRRQAADQLAISLRPEFAAMSMSSATMVIDVRPVDLGPHGGDEIEFLFSANSGSTAQPLSKSASGGELSRIMLALEVVLADRGSVPTLVFDEVDAGIGGKTAIEVGRRLRALSTNAQVIAVTHLPQVAAFAHEQFVVTKSDDGTVTDSSVSKLATSERVDELARMLGGVADSEAAQAHARELLELADQ